MPKRFPPLPALRAFEAAARHENISRAAEELGITHGAVSRQIQALESHAGLALFERAHRRVRLTPAGAVYARRLRGYLDGISEIFDTPAPDAVTPSLTLAARPDVAQHWLAPRLGGFTVDGLRPRIVLMAEEELTTFPAGVDAIISTIDTATSADGAALGSEVLATNWVFPLGPPRLLDQAAGPDGYLTESALQRLPLVHMKDPTEWEAVAVAMGLRGLDVESGQFHHYQGMVLEAAASGAGIAVGDETVARPFLESGRLRLALPIRLHDPQPYRFLYRQESGRRGAVIQAFRDWLRDEARDHRVWFDAFWAARPQCFTGTAPPMTLAPPVFEAPPDAP